MSKSSSENSIEGTVVFSDRLSDEQRVRVAALHEARRVTAGSSFLHTDGAEIVDLITVAQWIVDGDDPWYETAAEPTIKPDDAVRLRFAGGTSSILQERENEFP